jgi:hypothetical protein
MFLLQKRLAREAREQERQAKAGKKSKEGPRAGGKGKGDATFYRVTVKVSSLSSDPVQLVEEISSTQFAVDTFPYLSQTVYTFLHVADNCQATTLTHQCRCQIKFVKRPCQFVFLTPWTLSVFRGEIRTLEITLVKGSLNSAFPACTMFSSCSCAGQREGHAT